MQLNIVVISKVLFRKRRDLSNERNNSKSKTRTKLKPERSTRPIPKASVRDSFKADPEKKASVRATATMPIPKRRRPLYKAHIESKRSAKRWRYEEDLKENRAAQTPQRRRYGRTSRRIVLLKGADVKGTLRRTVLLKGGDMKRISRETELLKRG